MQELLQQFFHLQLKTHHLHQVSIFFIYTFSNFYLLLYCNLNLKTLLLIWVIFIVKILDDKFFSLFFFWFNTIRILFFIVHTVLLFFHLGIFLSGLVMVWYLHLADLTHRCVTDYLVNQSYFCICLTLDWILNQDNIRC